MGAWKQKDDVLKIPFWPSLGGEQCDYYFFTFYKHPVYVNPRLTLLEWEGRFRLEGCAFHFKKRI